MSSDQAKAHTHEIDFRYEPLPADRERVRRLVAATSFFRDDEVAVAVELVEERLAKGPASGYEFVFADVDGAVAGYACYGPIACTVWSYDLFWIAVDPAYQGHGLGRALIAESERLIRDAGGRRIYIETSGKPLYVSTRGFYERCGYVFDVEIAEFYGPGDSKVVYVKELA
ncbi:MAG: GNAT family N-acetyltransferase [Planctomycetaceae bacterium]|nr:GNAT family N-acetyltransferase [Planctomycetaceae bacterium]